jgi:two-component sensor histidine kinase
MNDRCNSQPKEALSFGPLLGLIIAELVTNAAKHAFHGRNGGLVRVALFNINES